MKLKEFESLKVGDIVRTKNRKGRVIYLCHSYRPFAEISYLDTGRNVSKGYRQIHLEEK